MADISIFNKGLQDTPTKDMAAAKEYTDEQLNYFKICHVATVILTEGLRTVFKREWDSRFGTTLGEWKDDPSNGKDFYNAESPRNKHMLSTMIKGNRVEWDSTMLFYAILFADCIDSLNRVVRTHVNNLRKFRNEFAHMQKGQLSELDFKIAISKVSAAFQALDLSTVEIQQITNQKSFPTEELRDVLDKLKELKKDLLEKENKDLADQLQKKESQRKDLEDQLQETRKQRICLDDQLKESEKHPQVLKNESKETIKKQEIKRDLRSLEYQMQKSEFQRQVLSEKLLVRTLFIEGDT